MSRLDKFNALLLALIFAAMPCWAQFTIPFATGAANSAPVTPIIQTAGDATHCGVFATNPSTTCAFASNVAAGHHILVTVVSDPAATSITAPTATGLTFAACGTPSTSYGAWISSSTSAQAYTVNLAAATTAGVGLQGVMYEVVSAAGACDGATYGSQAFCSSCTGPSLTTTVSGDLVINGFTSSSAVTSVTYTAPFAASPAFFDNPSSGQSQGNGYDVQATAGPISASWTNGTAVSGGVMIVAVKP